MNTKNVILANKNVRERITYPRSVCQHDYVLCDDVVLGASKKYFHSCQKRIVACDYLHDLIELGNNVKVLALRITCYSFLHFTFINAHHVHTLKQTRM